MKEIAVLGAGSWGTALALLLASKHYDIKLWSCESDLVAEMRRIRENRRYLPGHLLPRNIMISDDLSEAIAEVDTVVFSVPSCALRRVAEQFAAICSTEPLIINAAKGLESETGLRLSEVLCEVLPPVLASRIVVLSGPNLAVELANDIPTATVVASHDLKYCLAAQDLFWSRSLRVYHNNDIVGVELGGALKNVIAIGAGIADGLGYGDNTKATLLTRGLAEMTRLGVALGAQERTFRGLSGVGDLMATCASKLSRNLRVGMALGRGSDIETALAEVKQTAEGVPTCRAAYNLSKKHGVYTPIIEQIYRVCFERKSPVSAVIDLMLAEAKAEFE